MKRKPTPTTITAPTRLDVGALAAINRGKGLR